jgi:flagellar assembly protein FliH
MANSSEWIALLSQPDEPSIPLGAPAGWLAALDQRGEFRPGAPFAKPAPAPPDALSEPTPEEALAAALAEARAEGEAEGRAAAHAESAAEDEHRRTLRLAFRTLDAAALDALAAQLAETVIALCGEVLQDWTPDPGALAARCRAAASLLAEAPAALALHLHPADIEALEDEAPEALAGWRVVPDPALARGALRLEGPNGAVRDGPEEWRRAIAEAVRG